MTHQETIRGAYEAWSRRDLAAVLELVHPAAEVRPILGANFETDVYRGHEGIRRWMEDLLGEWDDFEVRVTDFVQRGDHMLCPFQIRARGRASGAVIEGEMFHVIEMRDGLIVRLDAFRERSAAVDALDAT